MSVRELVVRLMAMPVDAEVYIDKGIGVLRTVDYSGDALVVLSARVEK